GALGVRTLAVARIAFPLAGFGSGLHLEPGERYADGFRDVQGQGPVDRDEAIRDEGPSAAVAAFDMDFREAFLSQESGQGRQVPGDTSGGGGIGRIRGDARRWREG